MTILKFDCLFASLKRGPQRFNLIHYLVGKERETCGTSRLQTTTMTEAREEESLWHCKAQQAAGLRNWIEGREKGAPSLMRIIKRFHLFARNLIVVRILFLKQT